MKPIRRFYTIRQKRVVEDYYTIEAESKADALRQFEDDRWFIECETYTEKEYKASAEHSHDILECPNKGEGWSDMPLVKDMDVGAFGWHYNGKCKGERNGNSSHCHLCTQAMKTGKRLLTLEEKRYLKKKYSENGDLNTEE